MSLRVAILEDNNKDFENACSFISEWSQERGINTTIIRFTDDQILKTFTEDKFDILFADIDLDHTDTGAGFIICRELRELGYHNSLVFLTNNRDYALKGYEVSAAGYILKPLSHNNLSGVMKRAIDTQLGNFYYINDRSHITQIAFDDIVCIEKSAHHIHIYTTTGQTYSERTSLSGVLTRLPSQFIQCHKSSIINTMHVEHIRGNNAYMSNGHSLLIGRSYLSSVRKCISGAKKNHPASA